MRIIVEHRIRAGFDFEFAPYISSVGWAGLYMYIYFFVDSFP